MTRRRHEEPDWSATAEVPLTAKANACMLWWLLRDNSSPTTIDESDTQNVIELLKCDPYVTVDFNEEQTLELIREGMNKAVGQVRRLYAADN